MRLSASFAIFVILRKSLKEKAGDLRPRRTSISNLVVPLFINWSIDRKSRRPKPRRSLNLSKRTSSLRWFQKIFIKNVRLSFMKTNPNRSLEASFATISADIGGDIVPLVDSSCQMMTDRCSVSSPSHPPTRC